MSVITFSGLASGIDSSSLISALLDQERSYKIEPLKKAITAREATRSAFSELKTLLRDFSSLLQPWRSVNGGPIAKQLTSSNEAVLTGVASNAATPGTYSFTVNQLATNGTFTFDDRFSSADAVINSAITDGATSDERSVIWQIGQGDNMEEITVELTGDTTLTDLANEFNAQSENATASVINTGTEDAPSYALVIQSNTEGESEGFINLVQVGSEIQGAGDGAFMSNTLSQAKNLEISLAGVAGTISRSSNTVNDLLPGISFTASAEGSATLQVGVDSTSSKDSLAAAIEKYNEIVEFIKDNDGYTQEQQGQDILNVAGPLGNTSLDESLLTALRSVLSGTQSTGGNGQILADLGITTNRDGTLELNEETFLSALEDDPSGVASLLENIGEELGKVDGTISQYTRFGGLIDESNDSNTSMMADLEERILEAEARLSTREQSLISQFARLEAQISRLQSQQNSLASLLPS